MLIIRAATTRIVVTDSVALPTLTGACEAIYKHIEPVHICLGNIVGFLIFLLGILLTIIINYAICHEESEKDVKDLIKKLRSEPKEYWEEIINQRADSLFARKEPPIDKKRLVEKKKWLKCMLL
ncbi:hypothetical protein NHQ30_004327 [Ciborinia camelliae]|nr:hypothetical protein NHQ30_004327 [Ciborinia camelliae]